MRRIDLFKMYGELSESIGDNKVDNMVDELKSVIEIELANFVITLLNTNFSAFENSYTNPQFEGFRKALNDLKMRYKVMDNLDKQDLFNKIELIFKDLFRKIYCAQGPEVAELIGTRYAEQMVKNIKHTEADPMGGFKDTTYKNDTLMPDGLNNKEQQAAIPPFENHIY